MEDRDSLEYLIKLKEKYAGRYEDKPQKPKAAETAQAQIKHDSPLSRWPFICGGIKTQEDNIL